MVAGAAHSRGIDYVSCEFDEAAGVLEVTERLSEGALIRRAGERIAALQPNGDGGFAEVDCGATPTVTNTDRIVYRLTSDGITNARLSLANGPLAPGRTAEDPTSEIETVVQPGRSSESAEFSIRGTQADDHFRAGTLGTSAGVNLNVASEPTDPDVDITVRRPRGMTLSLRTDEGDDRVDLTGGPERLGPLNVEFATVGPGAGNDLVRSSETSVYAIASDGADVIRLGKRFDGAEGGRGRDTISTGQGRDLILPGPGRDDVRAGGKRDQIFGSSGGVDAIDCGAGRDRVIAGPRDRLRNCERVKRIAESPEIHFGFD